MSIFTNYDKIYQDLIKESDRLNKQWERELTELRDIAKEKCEKYNSEIGVINSERVQMRKEIKTLYDFLTSFGDAGVQITIFDFTTEHMKSVSDIQSDSCPTHSIDEMKSGKAYNVGKFVTSVMCTANPVFAPVLVGLNIHKKSKNRKSCEEFQKEINDAMAQNSRNIDNSKDLIAFFETAYQIAKIYRNTIVTIRDAISETIIPELNGIKAFLYADAIASKIDSGINLHGELLPTDIREIEGTKYNEHYLFVRNTCDYYNLIVALFKEQILTKIVEDNKITQAERKDFENKVNRFKEEKLKLEQHVMFNKE